MFTTLGAVVLSAALLSDLCFQLFGSSPGERRSPGALRPEFDEGRGNR